jgi:hypothetical protein
MYSMICRGNYDVLFIAGRRLCSLIMMCGHRQRGNCHQWRSTARIKNDKMTRKSSSIATGAVQSASSLLCAPQVTVPIRVHLAVMYPWALCCWDSIVTGVFEIWNGSHFQRDLVIGIPVQIIIGNTLPIMACDFNNGGDRNNHSVPTHVAFLRKVSLWSLDISMHDCCANGVDM